MNNEKQRLFLFFALALSLTLGTQTLLDALGLLPKSKPRPKGEPRAGAQVERIHPAKDIVKDKAGAGSSLPENVFEPAGPIASVEPPTARIDPGSLRLGSATLKDTNPYRLAVQLDQRGASVVSVISSRYEAELEFGKKDVKPLRVIGGIAPELLEAGASLETIAPYSFALTVSRPGEGNAPTPLPPGARASDIDTLDWKAWEVVADDKGRLVRPISKEGPAPKGVVEGQEIVFRTRADDPDVEVTKTYRLFEGEDGFELELGFASPSADRTLQYRLLGPHDLPIEGEWYTGTFRDVFFGQKDLALVAQTAADVVKKRENPTHFSAAPLRFAGVENQYFAVLLQPDPLPATTQDGTIQETNATVLKDAPGAPQKADVSVVVTSKTLEVGPNRPQSQTFRIYAGPKRAVDLAPFGAEALASYHKNQWVSIPFASSLATNVIAPLLDRIYALTKQVAGIFGFKAGSYGIAIILLTITVRLILFPLSRKQAISAKKMQDLQPKMAELKEKFKDDKEAMTRETFAMYKKHGVNPMGGCLPALIQLPIFVGLWQALNNAVHLRHASFLWIRDLAAPDMLFRFPATIPFLGDYFNLLPFLVVSLMLVQTKLFSPPPTTPEAEMQQKMMKFMMIFMAFIFYKVPSGLGIYFITSSSWAICERLLLPKLVSSHATPGGGESGNGPPRGGRGDGPTRKPDGPPTGWLAKRLGRWQKIKEEAQRIMDEASQDRTIRKDGRDPARDRDQGGKEKEKDKARPKLKPGKRR